MKIQIIGCGIVGSSIGNEILNSRKAKALLLVDKDLDRAKGEELDLDRVRVLKKIYTALAHTGSPATRGCNLSIISLGQRCQYDKFSTREAAVQDLYRVNYPDVKRVAAVIEEGVILVVTNPAEQIAAQLRRDLPGKIIISAGSQIDRIQDGPTIHSLKGWTNWGIAAEVGGLIEAWNKK